ncbi:MAG: hypothetical protein ACR2QA_15375, partial [Solirubrobacteraceae bacterium]
MKVHPAAIGEGPLHPAAGTASQRILRRVRNITLEVLAFLISTALLPLIFLLAGLVDLALWLRRRKPWVGVRMVAALWW